MFRIEERQIPMVELPGHQHLLQLVHLDSVAVSLLLAVRSLARHKGWEAGPSGGSRISYPCWTSVRV